MISESGYLGKNYRPDENNAFDLQTLLAETILAGGISDPSLTMDINDVTLADVIISREHSLTGGEEQPPEGDSDTGEEQTRNSFAESLGLSADVEYGEHYWIDQIIMLGAGSSSTAEELSEEQKVFDSFKDKYNAWRTANGMKEKTSPDELMVITATLASSALADNNAAFKLLPDYFTVTVIMDLSLTDEQREALKDASIVDVVGSEDGSTLPKEEFEGVFSVAVFINDMDSSDIGALAGVLASNPDTANLAQTVFGTDLNNKVRRFLLSFALHEHDETEGVNDPLPDIGMYKVLACSEVLPVQTAEQPSVTADETVDGEPPVYDTAAMTGLGKLAINVSEFAKACEIDLGALIPTIT